MYYETTLFKPPNISTKLFEKMYVSRHSVIVFIDSHNSSTEFNKKQI